MELLDTPSSGRGSLELEGVSPLKELLCRAYSVHVDIITDLQKQVSSLTALLTEKERELQDTTCQRCDSVKAAFERYKANHQRIIEKQEDKILLLENRISRYEKEQRERDGSPTVCFRTPDRATAKGSAAGGCRRQFPNSPFSAHRGTDDMVLQEDSPMDPSHLVPPSPDGCDAHSKHETIPETELGGHKLGARERPLAMLFRTVPETLECDLYGNTDNDITQYVPPLSAVLEQEEGGGPSNGLNVRDDEGPSNPEKGKVERGMVGRGDPPVGNAGEEEEVIDLVSQESPSLLQPRSTVSRSIKVRCEAPTAVDAPTDASDGSSCVPRVQPAPSVLDSFAVPKPLPKPGDSRDVTAPAERDDFVCSPETRRSTTKTLSLQRKRRTAEISKVTDDTGAQVRTTAKRKKQTKLSDKYFLSVNRCTPPVRARSSRKPAKELSQTHVDTHFTEDSVFSPNKRTVDPDETFVAPELLQDEFSPSVFDPLPPATEDEGPTGDKPGANGAVDSSADKGSASSASSFRSDDSPWRSFVNCAPKASSTATHASVSSPTSMAAAGTRGRCVRIVCYAIYVGSENTTEYGSLLVLSDSGFEFSVYGKATRKDSKKKCIFGRCSPVKLSPSDMSQVMVHSGPSVGLVIFVFLTPGSFRALCKRLGSRPKSAVQDSQCVDGSSSNIVAFFSLTRLDASEKVFLQSIVPPGALWEIGQVAANRIIAAERLSPLSCLNRSTRGECDAYEGSDAGILTEASAFSSYNNHEVAVATRTTPNGHSEESNLRTAESGEDGSYCYVGDVSPVVDTGRGRKVLRPVAVMPSVFIANGAATLVSGSPWSNEFSHPGVMTQFAQSLHNGYEMPGSPMLNVPQPYQGFHALGSPLNGDLNHLSGFTTQVAHSSYTFDENHRVFTQQQGNWALTAMQGTMEQENAYTPSPDFMRLGALCGSTFEPVGPPVLSPHASPQDCWHPVLDLSPRSTVGQRGQRVQDPPDAFDVQPDGMRRSFPQRCTTLTDAAAEHAPLVTPTPVTQSPPLGASKFSTTLSRVDWPHPRPRRCASAFHAPPPGKKSRRKRRSH